MSILFLLICAGVHGELISNLLRSIKEGGQKKLKNKVWALNLCSAVCLLEMEI